MRELMQQLEADGTPAPAPIEQRWSAASSADMSPVAARGEPDGLHSWVGIIMYLPAEDRHTRKAITDRSAHQLSARALSAALRGITSASVSMNSARCLAFYRGPSSCTYPPWLMPLQTSIETVGNISVLPRCFA